MPLLRSFLVLLLAVLASGVARAHDPFENTIDIGITSDVLEVTAVLSPPSATGLLKNSGGGKITRDNFASFRADLLAAAVRVCALLDAEGKAIPPSRTLVSLNHEGEVAYLFEFPATTGPASLRSDLIASLGTGYYCEVTDRTVSPARHAVLVRTKPACPLPVTATVP
jgi:hypothetical protein